MFRILTEDKDVDQIKAALNGLGLDFTLLRGTGSWKGKEELSLAVELDHVTRKTAEGVALTIKAMNQQDAILLQEFRTRSELL